jgi:hypothetical protein
MKAKRPSEKRAAPTNAPGSTKDSGKLILTPLQKVRVMLDLAIKIRRCKDSDTRHRLKEALAQFPFDSIGTFQLLNTASENSANDLAFELADPACVVIDAIWQMSLMTGKARAIAHHCKREDWQKAAARVSDQVDLALALILRALIPRVGAAAMATKNEDLLFEVLNILIGDGHEASNLIARYQELCAGEAGNEGGSLQAGSFAEHFAWDAYLRVAALDKLVDRYPKNIRPVARQMNAWPMLRYFHNDRQKRFEQIADKLELGADYPLDVSKGPAWRPDTPIVQYLDTLVYRFYSFGLDFLDVKKWEPDELKAAQWAASEPWEDQPSKVAVKALLDSISLPKLTKDTAKSWANVAIVPYIMVTDAKTPTSCSVPALQSIWKQKRVKSAATFKSRLKPLVVRTLVSMSRA